MPKRYDELLEAEELSRHGKGREAESCLRLMMKKAQTDGNPLRYAAASHRLGLLLVDQGMIANGKAALNEALEIYEGMCCYPLAVTLRGYLGQIYIQERNLPELHKQTTRITSIAEKIGNHGCLVRPFVILGYQELVDSHPDLAERWFERARSISAGTDPQLPALILVHRIGAMIERGDKESAVKEAETFCDLGRVEWSGLDLAQVNETLSALFYTEGVPLAALRHGDMALRAGSTGLSGLRNLTRMLLAASQVGWSGHKKVELLEVALGIIRSCPGLVPGARDKDAQRVLHQFAEAVFQTTDDPSRIFEALEWSKIGDPGLETAKAALQALDMARRAPLERLVAEIAHVTSSLYAIAYGSGFKEIFRRSRQDRERMEKELLLRLEALETEVYEQLAAALGPGLALSSTREQRPVPLDAVCPPQGGQVFLHYFVGSDRCYVAIFDERFPVVVPLGKKSFLRNTLAHLLETMERERSGSKNYSTYLQILYRELIQPISDRLDRRLVISPHGFLFQIPFAALGGPEEYLIDSHELLIVPNGSLHAQACRQIGLQIPPSIIAVVNPTGDFEYALTELAAIREVFPDASLEVLDDGSLVSGCRATNSAVVKAISGKNIIHFACHGKYIAREPYLSFLCLAPENPSEEGEYSPLFAWQLVSSNLAGALVVLSACESGKCSSYEDEGMDGWLRVLLADGARNVLSSYWVIEDASSARLIARFYHHYRNTGSPCGALALAQREQRQDPRYAHPFHWASFYCTGASEEERP